MVEITSEHPRVTGLETVIRLHRRYRGQVPPPIRKKVMRMRRLRQDGLPGRPPSATRRLDAIGRGMEWDAAAKSERQAVQRYSGSEDETRHREGENLPTAKNGSNS